MYPKKRVKHTCTEKSGSQLGNIGHCQQPAILSTTCLRKYMQVFCSPCLCNDIHQYLDWSPLEDTGLGTAWQHLSSSPQRCSWRHSWSTCRLPPESPSFRIVSNLISSWKFERIVHGCHIPGEGCLYDPQPLCTFAFRSWNNVNQICIPFSHLEEGDESW